jgi:hypothetical protein
VGFACSFIPIMVSVDEQAIVETTPLSNTSKKITPLPKLQLTILLILLLAEPITSTIIYPFINQVKVIPSKKRRHSLMPSE